jgi:hypothetical protein
MQRLPKEAFVAALPVLQQRLQEQFPSHPIKVTIANGTATPRNPFAPKLSSNYNFRVVVTTNWSRCMFIPYIRPSFVGPLAIGAVFASGWAQKEMSMSVSEWVRGLHEKHMIAAAKLRLAPLKEELIATAWHPRRVERWLAVGGWELLDTIAA